MKISLEKLTTLMQNEQDDRYSPASLENLCSMLMNHQEPDRDITFHAGLICMKMMDVNLIPYLFKVVDAKETMILLHQFNFYLYKRASQRYLDYTRARNAQSLNAPATYQQFLNTSEAIGKSDSKVEWAKMFTLLDHFILNERNCQEALLRHEDIPGVTKQVVDIKCKQDVCYMFYLATIKPQ